MKNVVLVTWKGRGNYGTCLQSYALYRKLQDLGYSVRFLSGIHKKYKFQHFVKWLTTRIGIKWFYDKVKAQRMGLKHVKRVEFQHSVFKDVVLCSKHQEENLVRQTDCFVTGSDQIWNTYFNFNPTYFLSFAKDKKRVAYASSIGTNSVREEYKEKVKNLLLRFNHIGVREEDTVQVLSELTGRDDIRQVVDPTFLLTPSDWKKMSKNAVLEMKVPNNYIFCYLIGNNEWYKEQLEDVRSKLEIDHIIIIASAENPNFSVSDSIVYRDAGPVEYVWLLQHASFVCTDSFHATALSINHSIPFVEFMRFKESDEKSQNQRIHDVLNHYGLQSRVYHKDKAAWASRIDYKSIQGILDKDRMSSLDYLVSSIEK